MRWTLEILVVDLTFLVADLKVALVDPEFVLGGLKFLVVDLKLPVVDRKFFWVDLKFIQKHLFRPAPAAAVEAAAAKHPYQTSFQSPHLLRRAGKALPEVSFNGARPKIARDFIF